MTRRACSPEGSLKTAGDEKGAFCGGADSDAEDMAFATRVHAEAAAEILGTERNVVGGDVCTRKALPDFAESGFAEREHFFDEKTFAESIEVAGFRRKRKIDRATRPGAGECRGARRDLNSGAV